MNKHSLISAIQSQASQYTLRALNSGYIPPQELSDIDAGIIQSISGSSLRQLKNPHKNASLLKRHLSATPGHQQDTVDHNSQVFSQALQLPTGAWRLISLIAVLEASSGLAEFLRQVMPHDSSANQLLAFIVDMDYSEFKSVLSQLKITGIFESACINMSDFITLPKALIDRLVGSKVDCHTELITPLMQFKDTSILKLKDFSYLETETLWHFLDAMVNQSTVGINVLFYGTPGTGKTELSKVLADKLNASLIAVKALGDDINEQEVFFGARTSSSNLKLQYHQLIQRLISPREKNLLLMDECEDIFEQGISARGNGKDTLHGLLEKNPIPTI